MRFSHDWIREHDDHRDDGGGYRDLFRPSLAFRASVWMDYTVGSGEETDQRETRWCEAIERILESGREGVAPVGLGRTIAIPEKRRCIGRAYFRGLPPSGGAGGNQDLPIVVELG